MSRGVGENAAVRSHFELKEQEEQKYESLLHPSSVRFAFWPDNSFVAKDIEQLLVAVGIPISPCRSSKVGDAGFDEVGESNAARDDEHSSYRRVPRIASDDESDTYPVVNSASEDSFNNSKIVRVNDPSITGRVFLLGTPQDDQILSEAICFLRSQIEVFEATQNDVEARLKRGGTKSQRELAIGRVGLRCIYCSHLPPSLRPKGATTYPTLIRLVYQAVRNLQRYHFASCPNMPPKEKARLAVLTKKRQLSNRASVGYWEKCCKGQGMLDTREGGIRLM